MRAPPPTRPSARPSRARLFTLFALLALLLYGLAGQPMTAGSRPPPAPAGRPPRDGAAVPAAQGSHDDGGAIGAANAMAGGLAPAGYLPLIAVDPRTTFAVIGDFGANTTAEGEVAALVKSWDPAFVITVGDNNYSVGAAATIDANIGKYYQEFIFPYQGAYGSGAASNAFWPSLGNHDWLTTNAQPYLDYFTLPNNERYYDVVQGPVHLFALDSDAHEPDGITSTSVQATWLQNRLAASTAPWKVVYFHHAPYSSGVHGPATALQWPFKAWGASVVLAGHDHTYERVLVDDMTYIVNGLGGAELYDFGTPIAGSQVRYNGDYGALRVDATTTTLTLTFINRAGTLIDAHTLTVPGLRTPTRGR